jgi:multidrug resistance protein, MATE family
MYGAFIIGVFNFLFLLVAGAFAAHVLTGDRDVIRQVASVLPVVAAFQLFDSLATTLNGFLRGLGKQAIGSIISLASYYTVALPFSFGAAFWLHWNLVGLWSGIAVALIL